jgi:exodeoxyribonuclease VII large subunit
VLFARKAPMLRFTPEDGMEILLRGKLSVYEQRGQMQLIAETLEPVGAGALQIAFEQLKARLAAEGLFAAERKRPLPPFPHCVGIITSPAGAVIRDFLNVSNRRHAGLDVLLFPATVQGDTAVHELIAGLAYFNRMRNVEVIVLARGGGSLEDLAAFNDERLARAIAASTLPVVSAVGHETDFTIADFVADLRAPTPSAAAELITAAQHRVGEQVAEHTQRLARAVRYQLMLARQHLGALPAPPALAARFADRLNRREQVLDQLRFRLEATTRNTFHFASARLARCSVEAATARLRASIADRRGAIEALRFRLEAAHAIGLQAACDRLTAAQHALARHHPAQRMQLMRTLWTAAADRLARLAPTLARGSRARFSTQDAQLARVAGTLTMSAGRRHAAQDTHLLRTAPRLCDAPLMRFSAAQRQLEALSPFAVLSRGYALVLRPDGALVKRAADVKPQDLLHIRLAEGTLAAHALTSIQDTSDKP